MKLNLLLLLVLSTLASCATLAFQLIFATIILALINFILAFCIYTISIEEKITAFKDYFSD